MDFIDPPSEFSFEPNEPTQPATITSTVAFLGVPDTGKSCLLNAVAQTVLTAHRSPSMPLQLRGSVALAQLVAKFKKSLELLRLSGMPSTTQQEELVFEVFGHVSKGPTLLVRDLDPEGAIFTEPVPSASYLAYLDQLREAYVKLVAVPSDFLDRQGEHAADISLMAERLQETLERRPGARPCSVAIVVTMADAVAENESCARRLFGREFLLSSLGQLVDVVEASDLVTHAAIFVTTAYGFGKAIRKELSASNGNGESHFANKRTRPQWILQGDADPFNVRGLISWTTIHALRHVEAELTAGDEKALSEAFDELVTNYDGWHVQFKGDNVCRR